MRILIIEDDKEIIDFLLKGFEYEGYEVDSVNDGQSALEMIYQGTYDVILLDLMLPEINGQELLEEIRSKNIKTPVILLSAVAEYQSKIDLLNSGADDYVDKPFSFHELVARINAVLRRSGRSTLKDEKVKIGDLTLYPHRKEVYRHEKQIILRNKEFELLEYLAENVDTVVKRDQLLEDIWEYHSGVCSNTVDTHISSLRRKIDEGYENKLIHTIHAVGYKLSVEEKV